MDLIFKNNKYNEFLSEISNNVDLRCNICKEEILVDSINLSCNHKFHCNCLRNSFNITDKPVCPLCSRSINFSESTCIIENCKKKSYNCESMCITHCNKYLKLIVNEKNKQKKIINQTKKKIQNKIEKLKQKKLQIINEILILEDKLTDLNT